MDWMNWRACLTGAAAVVLPMVSASAAQPVPRQEGGAPSPVAKTEPTARLDLRVLYLGDGEGERAGEFVTFLRSRCKAVRAGDRERVMAADLDGIDVVVIDGDPTLHAQRVSARREVKPLDFELFVGVPTVLVGWVGLSIGSHWKLKTSLFYG